MKVNREQFLAAALLFASTTGCGKIAERMKGEFNASQDPAAAPVAVNQNPANVPGAAAADPAAIARNPKSGVAPPVAKNGAVNAKAPVGGPAKEGIGPASENIAPSKENWGPANENVAPSKESWGPANENLGPSNESWRRRRGPANENWGPANENIKPRPHPGPANENIPQSPKKPAKKAKSA